jgi:hypothetical protein
MAFVKEQGGTRRYKAVIQIKSKGTTEPRRRQELKDFERGLRDLARKHLGRVEPTTPRKSRKPRST